jgi:dipeptidyl aminopeptidase/acylaminoacyl peptidase
MENPSEQPAPSDPRLVAKCDRSVLAALKMFGMDRGAPPVAFTGSTYEEKVAHYDEVERMYQPLMNMLGDGLTEQPGVTTETVVIKGVDNNDINLYISTPTGPSSTPRPCVYHIHGGGMTVLTAQEAVYVAHRAKVASLGFIVVGVEFR